MKEEPNFKIKIKALTTNQACFPLLQGNLQLFDHFYIMYINSMAFFANH